MVCNRSLLGQLLIKKMLGEKKCGLGCLTSAEAVTPAAGSLHGTAALSKSFLSALLLHSGSEACWIQSQQSRGEGRVATCASRQFITASQGDKRETSTAAGRHTSRPSALHSAHFFLHHSRENVLCRATHIDDIPNIQHNRMKTIEVAIKNKAVTRFMLTE